MQFITAHQGKLQTLSELETTAAKGRRGAIHELLFHPRDGQPAFVAAIIAEAVPCISFDVGCSMLNVQLQTNKEQSPIIWSDPHRQLYPPALVSLGFDLRNLYLLRTDNPKDESWAITECLRCPGVGAVIAAPKQITRVEARRYQLAAERGGGMGIFMRPLSRGDDIYAAATRWRVAPHPGERTIQRWTIQLLHGHGGRIGQTLLLEWNRENNSVRAIEKLADRSTAAADAPKRAIA
jgi:hypothetical protein